MSITPPSDIVLGVASAADPEKYRAAVEKLASLNGNNTSANSPAATAATAAAGEDFSVPAVKKPQQSAPSHAAPEAAGTTAAQTPPATPGREMNAYKKFEAYLMQTFIESMLPKDAAHVFGSGTPGNIWRSMLAEHMANEMSRGAALGIAESIARHRAQVKQSAASAPSDTASNVQAAAIPDQRSLIANELQAALAMPSMSSFFDRRGS